MEPTDNLLEYNRLLVRAMVDDLHQETDEKKALRKALCMLIVLLDDPDPDIAALITFLLMIFKPLAGHFRENRHPLVAEAECLRAPIEDKSITVISKVSGYA